MKWAIVPLLVLVAVVLGMAWMRGPDVLQAGIKISAQRFLMFLPILACVFLLVGMIDVLLPKDAVQRLLSDSAGWRGIGIAWLAGALTPAGMLAGMPVVAGLFQAGAGVGVLVTYLTSLSVLSIIRAPMEVGIYGPRLAAIRIIACFFLPPLAGVTAQALAPLFGRR